MTNNIEDHSAGMWGLNCGVLVLQYKATPLHTAVTAGRTESVQLLLAANGNPNAENSVSSLAIAIMIELCGTELCG